MKSIVSTLSSNFTFVRYGKAEGNNIPPVLARVVLKGKANIPGTHGQGVRSATADGIPLWTPQGVVTRVTEADYEWLKDDPAFRGFVNSQLVIVTDSDPGDSQKALRRIVEDMSPRDSHSPITPNDPRVNVKKITTGSPNDED